MPRTKSTFLLLLAGVLSLSANSWGGDDTQRNQSASSSLLLVRTYAPEDFRRPFLDRLSGIPTRGFPFRMATDSKGRVLVTDPALSVVHVFDLKQGKRWELRGGSYHWLSRPAYIAVDGGDNIYVTDLDLPFVMVFRPSGQFLRTIGYGSLSLPTGIWVDSPNRLVYVADWWQNQVLSFDFEGNLIHVFGTPGQGPGQLQRPGDIAIHGDTLIVLDSVNRRFDLFDLQGNFRGIWPFGADRMPLTFTFDGGGHLVYVDLYSGGLVATDPQGTVIARLDQLRSYGQSRPAGISFTCVAAGAGGDILALRPTLNVETVRLAAGAPTRVP
ncbi:MAG: 6-bladed beta-propeller [Candidatus Sulfotelmatobacter sp.]